ncbi:MAG: hypothetical protein WB696_01585 [Chthoniobacterales bacterium]
MVESKVVERWLVWITGADVQKRVAALAGEHLRNYLALACRSRLFGVGWAGKQHPKPKSLAKLQRFLDAEAKRPLQGDGIRPIEGVPYKIIKPIQQVRYARLCPFCRKERGKIL